MSKPTGPKSPVLGVAGADLWCRLTASPAPGVSLEFSPSELVLLEAACRQQDDIALLESSLATDGPVVAGSRGQPKLSGVVAELRLQRAALARLLALLSVSDQAEDQVPRSAASSKAQRAAQARWRNHERREGRHATGSA